MSFYSNFQSDKCPCAITGNPLNGLTEKVCIQAEKIFDACIRQTQVQNYALTITDGKPDATDLAAFGLRYVTPTTSHAANPKEEQGIAPLLPLSTDGTTVQLTAIKRDANGELIVRMYESCGRAATVTLPAAVLASPTDLLEDMTSDERTATLTFKPFEIKTVRLH